jgi:hypothetical protein
MLSSMKLSDVRVHPWFAGFNWSDLETGAMPAPFIPDSTRANVDTGTHDLIESFEEVVNQHANHFD